MTVSTECELLTVDVRYILWCDIIVTFAAQGWNKVGQSNLSWADVEA